MIIIYSINLDSSSYSIRCHVGPCSVIPALCIMNSVMRCNIVKLAVSRPFVIDYNKL